MRQTPMNLNSRLARFVLMGLALALSVVSRSRAGSETVLHVFHGKDGWGGGESACPNSRGLARPKLLICSSGCPAQAPLGRGFREREPSV